MATREGFHGLWYFMGNGIMNGIFFAVTGSIGIFAASKPSNCSVSAFMVLSIISSVYSVPWFVYSCITTNTYSYSYRYSSNVVIYGIQCLVSLIESVIAITASGYSCRVFCCGKVQNPGAIQYQNPGTIQYQNPGLQNPGTVLYSPGQGAVAIQNPQTFMVSPGAA